jgi:cystathionine beta-lyase/cystathionine gamma-synthase
MAGDRVRSLHTRAVHAGERDRERGLVPTVGPIYASNTFLCDTPEEMDRILGGEQHGYTYARHLNPTAAALGRAVADLEGGGFGMTYASGMAAVLASLAAVPLRQGDVVLAGQDLYGASISLVDEVLGPLGVVPRFGDLADPDGMRGLIEAHRPRAILVESISNPLLRLVDGAALVEAGHAVGATVIVDNTFATPVLNRPLDWGADMVVHSATKYLSGHGDVTAGVVVTRDADLAGRLTRQVKLLGGILGPFEAWLVHRGLKTLPLRFERQCDSALIVARRLAESGRFTRVVHPLLPDHPDHGRALRDYPAGRCGAVVTLDLGGDRDRVHRFLSSLRLVLSATTVGDVYTLCLYPAMASHRSLSAEQRARAGITDSTVRIAVGIEDPEDILEDILDAADLSARGLGRPTTV